MEFSAVAASQRTVAVLSRVDRFNGGAIGIDNGKNSLSLVPSFCVARGVPRSEQCIVIRFRAAD